jgi:hypothetical protein
VAVCKALETQERSLSLAALLWRAVSEPLFDPNNTTTYSEVERQVLRDTLAAIGLTAEEWRQDIFARNLDPYVTGGRCTAQPRGPVSKAGPRPGDRETYALSKDLNEERWGVGTNPDSREAVEVYLAAHRYAEHMDLTFWFVSSGSLMKYSAGESEVLPPNHPLYGYRQLYTMSVFDVIVAVDSVRLAFDVTGDITTAGLDEGNLLNDLGQEEELTMSVGITLEAGREYTYVELLNAIFQPQRDPLLLMANSWLTGTSVTLWNRSQTVITAARQNGALLWPAFRDIMAIDCAVAPPKERNPYVCAEAHRRAVLKDIDFWMF